MAQPLAGIKVVELASYAMAPFACAIMADWGASVIKIEPPAQGDPLRRMTAWNIPATEGCSSYMFAAANRGKRSVALDVATPEGRDVLEKLLAQADVFVTNFLPAVQRRLRVAPADIWAINPRMVYGRGSGYGTLGEEADKGGYDGAVYWSRTGMVQAVTPPGLHPLRMPGPSLGDAHSGTGLAAGILAALLQRERTGEVSVVDTSLLLSGMWGMQASYGGLASVDRDRFTYPERLERADNPLTFPYRTADDRFVHISMLDSEKFWPGLCEVLAVPGLVDDPRFNSTEQRSANRGALVTLLDEIFGSMPIAHWVEALSRQAGPWAVVTLPGEVRHDRQALANGYIQETPWDAGRSLPMVSAPAQFNQTAPKLTAAPTLGQHTDDILMEAGFSSADIERMRQAGTAK